MAELAEAAGIEAGAGSSGPVAAALFAGVAVTIAGIEVEAFAGSMPDYYRDLELTCNQAHSRSTWDIAVQEPVVDAASCCLVSCPL